MTVPLEKKTSGVVENLNSDVPGMKGIEMFWIKGPKVMGGVRSRDLQREVKAASLSGLSESEGHRDKCDVGSGMKVRVSEGHKDKCDVVSGTSANESKDRERVV
jgi:hypothetical protein